MRRARNSFFANVGNEDSVWYEPVAKLFYGVFNINQH